MSDKFLNRYRVSSARISNWDYSSNAAYLITICTTSRKNYFGEIIDSEMQLSNIGEYATECWMNIPIHFPYFYLDAFVIMPNHTHGIVLIEKPFLDNRRDFGIVETGHAPSLQQSNTNKSETGQESKHFRLGNQGKIQYRQWLILSNRP
jgi:hypothetical protein